MTKAQYWKNRTLGKRGQGEKDNPIFHAKGDEVKYITREGKTSLYANNTGENMQRSKSGKLIMVNRKDARKKNRSHPATKKNFEYQQIKNKFYHFTK